MSQNLPTTDYEIIIINDGSTDKTSDIIQNFLIQEAQDNIRVINQKNQGLSAARNVGLDEAKGEYVWFVDSDDWIEHRCLKGISDLLVGSGTDVVILETFMCQDHKEIVVCRECSMAQTTMTSRLFDKIWIYPYSGAQFYIFRRSYLITEKLRFREGIYFEDLLFTPVALAKSNTVFFYKHPIYHYRIRSNSITTTSVSPKKSSDLLFVLDRMLDLYGRSDSVNKEIYSLTALSIMKRLARSYINRLDKTDSDRIRNRLIENDDLWRILCNDASFKDWIIYLVVKYFPFLCGI